MAAGRSGAALTSNVGPFQRVPSGPLGTIAGQLDATNWYPVMSRVCRAFANPSAAEKLRARNIQVGPGWGSHYVHAPQWWLGGGHAQASQRNKYNSRGADEIDTSTVFGRLCALVAREGDDERRRKAVAEPERNGLVASYLRSAYRDTGWTLCEYDVSRVYYQSTLNQVQFVQLVRRLWPGQCERLQRLELCIPRPDRGSRSRGIAPQANLIEKEDLCALVRACPALQTLVLHNAKAEELNTFLSLERNPLSDPEEPQFPGALTHLELHSTSIDETTGAVLAKVRALRSVKIFGDYINAPLVAQTFSKSTLLNTVQFSGSHACERMQHLATIPSITALRMKGCQFRTWEGVEQLASMPNLRSIQWGNMSWPDRASSHRAMTLLVQKATALEAFDFDHWYEHDLDSLLRLGAQMRALKRVVIGTDSEITDAGLAALASCSQLSALRLCWRWSESRKLTDAGLMALSNCSQLTSLTLSGRHFTTEGVGRLLEGPVPLQKLDLRRTPHLSCAQLTALVDKLSKKVILLGSRYEQLAAVQSAFEARHPDRMKLLLMLPEVDRRAIYAWYVPYTFSERPGFDALIKQHGKQQFQKLAFLKDASLDAQYHFTDETQTLVIRLYLSCLLDRIKD
jgi:hypothetical protein